MAVHQQKISRKQTRRAKKRLNQLKINENITYEILTFHTHATLTAKVC